MRCIRGSTPASSFPQKLFAKLKATEGPSDIVPGMVPDLEGCCEFAFSAGAVCEVLGDIPDGLTKCIKIEQKHFVGFLGRRVNWGGWSLHSLIRV